MLRFGELWYNGLRRTGPILTRKDRTARSFSALCGLYFGLGRKTIAKDALYKQILQRIRRIYPSFNIGISTGLQDNLANRWQHPYRHWLFIPRDFEIDATKHKPTKR